MRLKEGEILSSDFRAFKRRCDSSSLMRGWIESIEPKNADVMSDVSHQQWNANNDTR